MDLDLKKKIGQKFVVGFYGTEITDEFRQAVQDYYFGNIILFRENLVDEEQTKRLCKELHDLVVEATGIAPIISIDQEGGNVTRLTDDSINIPSAMALAATADEALIQRMNFINGKVLLDHGFNLNLGPVLDINCEPDNPVIGVRSYSDDPQKVAKYGRIAFEALQEAGIMSSAKHFPGHGDTKVDSHIGLPKVDISREQLDQREFVPFVEAAHNGITTIMTTHILFPQLEKENYPATMSKTILTDILRKEMQFKGLIISDCMEMKAIADHYGTAFGTKTAFGAGVDLVFISHTPPLAVEAVETVYKAVEESELTIEQIEESYNRIQEYKNQWLKDDWSVTAEEYETYRTEIAAAMQKTFCMLPDGADLHQFPVDENTVVIGPKPYRTTSVSNVMQGEISFAKNISDALEVEHHLIAAKPTAEEIQKVVEAVKDASSIVLGLFNAHVFTEQLALWKALREVSKNILVVALNNPYDLMYLDKEHELGIAIFEYTGKSMLTLQEVLKNREQLTGTLPVEIPERTIGNE